MAESLFSRLVSYSQNPRKRSVENFLTEVIAYLINNDRAFRKAFIRLIIPDKRMLRGYINATALTQQSVDRGIVDLVLVGNRGKVLVEVKVGASETQTKIYGFGVVPQVKKYLSLRIGHVAYLTTRNIPAPEVSSRFFLGHFLIEELEGRLKRDRLTPTGQLFFDFLKENDMKALEPFSSRDLRNAGHSFDFARKCEATIDEIMNTVAPAFRKIFGVRSTFTSGHFSPTYYSSYSYTRRFKYGKVRRIFFFLQPWEGAVGFGLSAEVPRKDIERANRHLKWEIYRRELYSWHSVGPRIHPAALAKKAIQDTRALKKALNRVY